MAYAKHAAAAVARPAPAASYVCVAVIKEAEGYQLSTSRRRVTTGYMGVTETPNGRFKRGEAVGGNTVHIGTYDTAVEAAVAHAQHAAGRSGGGRGAEGGGGEGGGGLSTLPLEEEMRPATRRA